MLLYSTKHSPDLFTSPEISQTCRVTTLRRPCPCRAFVFFAKTECANYFGSRLHSFGMEPPPERLAPTTIGSSEVTLIV